MAVSYIDPQTNVRFNNVPVKTLGSIMDSFLTQANINGRKTVDYINSEDFYTLVNAIDIDWNGVILENAGLTINTTAELIQHINSLYAKFGDYLTKEYADTLYLTEDDLTALNTTIEAINDALNNKANKSDIPTRISQLDGYEYLATEYYVDYAVAHGAKSAYDIAVDNGFTGTEEEWLASLHGKDGTNGLSAWELAIQQGITNLNLYEWLQSLQGKDGYSAYQIALSHGFVGSEDEWLTSLRGEDGQDGAEGKSAYDVAVIEGFTGTQSEWVASLKGEVGATGATGPQGAGAKILGSYDTYQELLDATADTFNTIGDAYIVDGDIYVYNDNFTSIEDKWKNVGRIQGPEGKEGKSAYDIYKAKQEALGRDYLEEDEWLASLKGVTGERGPQGIQGKSAYDIYREKQIAQGKEPMNEDDWVNNLAGGYVAGANIKIEGNVISAEFNLKEGWNVIE